MVKTLSVDGICVGGNHIHVTIDDGEKKTRKTLILEDIQSTDPYIRDEYELICRTLGKELKKSSVLLAIKNLPL